MALRSEIRVPSFVLLEIVAYVGFSELNAAATSQVVDLGASVPADAIVEDTEVCIVTAFAHPSATTMTVKVGHASDDDAYATATSVLATGRAIPGGAAGERTPTAAKALKAKITADQNLGDGTDTDCTAGLLCVRLWYRMPEAVA